MCVRLTPNPRDLFQLPVSTLIKKPVTYGSEACKKFKQNLGGSLSEEDWIEIYIYNLTKALWMCKVNGFNLQAWGYHTPLVVHTFFPEVSDIFWCCHTIYDLCLMAMPHPKPLLEWGSPYHLKISLLKTCCTILACPSSIFYIYFNKIIGYAHV